VRAFIIKSDTAYIDEEKQAFQSGRLDVVLNSILAAIISRRAGKLVARRNVVVIAVMPRNDPPIIMINSNKLHDLIINEADLLKFINKARKGDGELMGAQGNMETVIHNLKRDNYAIFYLHEKGIPISNFLPLSDKTAFILGNQDGLSQTDERLIKRQGIAAVSLGSRPYMTWECVAILNSILDGAISFPS